MGMSCEVNTLLKLNPYQGFPEVLEVGEVYSGSKNGYRIYAMDIPILLMDSEGNTHGLVKITSLTWADSATEVEFEVLRVYEEPREYGY